MKNIDIRQIEHLYYHEEKSTYEIAAILGCSASTVSNKMEQHDMPLRSISEAHKNQHARNPRVALDITEIVRLYFEERLSLLKIGEQLGVSDTTIREKLLKAGYTLRAPYEMVHLKGRSSRFTDADVSEMERLYCEEELSLRKVAERIPNCTAATVGNKLRERGVRLRTAAEARALRQRKKGDVEKSAEVKEMPLSNYQTSSKTQQTRLERLETSVREGSRTEGNGDAHRGTHEQHPDFSAEMPTRTYTPPKRLGKVFEPIPLLRPEEVTLERILRLRQGDELTLDDIAAICSLSRVVVFNILREVGGL